MDEFISVNGEIVNLGEALRWSTVEEPIPFIDATRMRISVRQHAENLGLRASVEEIQERADALRQRRGLFSREATERWMRNSHLTASAIEEVCRRQALEDALRRNISEIEMAAFFEQNRETLWRIDLYGLRTRDKAEAEDIATRVRSGTANFHLEAMTRSRDEETARRGGYLGRLWRPEVPEDIRMAVFSVDPGEVLGPFSMRHGHEIFLVARILEPKLEELREEIRERLFMKLVHDIAARAIVFYLVFSEEA